jgi:hypothetical protein
LRAGLEEESHGTVLALVSVQKVVLFKEETMGLRLKALAIMAVLFAAQASMAAGHAARVNFKDPNFNPRSAFRAGLETGQLCDKMLKKIEEAEKARQASSRRVIHANGVNTVD